MTLRSAQTTHRLFLAQIEALVGESDLIDAPRGAPTRLTAAGLVDEVGRGLYCLSTHPVSEHESLAAVAIKVPQAV